jgi:hypothetical protein
MRQVSVGNNLTAATKTTVYTVPTGYYALWNLCYIVNHTGNNKTIDVFWYDKSTNVEIKVLDGYLLSPTNFLKFDGGAYIVLEEGDEIRVEAEAASSMSTINTFEVIRKA